MSKFQQRHYEAIAEVIQESYRNEFAQGPAETGVTVTMNQLVWLFSRDNTMFDPERFRRACKPGANVKARTR